MLISHGKLISQFNKYKRYNLPPRPERLTLRLDHYPNVCLTENLRHGSSTPSQHTHVNSHNQNVVRNQEGI